MGRGRGRGGTRGRLLKKNPPGRPPSDLTFDRIQTVTFPVTSLDEEIVQCSECDLSCTFRAFRLHNIEAHYNIAKTRDDPAPQDHKYFTRKLIELAKLTKITTFFCPRKPCGATYKSALGLAYHLAGCGKSAEEINANLLECDLCHKKYSAANMNWHKRTAHPPQVFLPYPSDENTAFATPSTGKRKSAVKALEFMKEISDSNIKVEGDDPSRVHLNEDERDEDFSVARYYMKNEYNDPEEFEADEVDEVDISMEVTPSIDFILGAEEIKLPSAANSNSKPGSSRPDFALQASKYLDAHPQSTSSDPWDTPLRVTEDPLQHVVPRINSFQPIEALKIRQYLPVHEKSVLFNTKTKPGKESPAEFHRLNWFEGEVTDNKENDFINFAGGPITSLAWHPSGRYLALSTLREFSESPNFIESNSRPSSIQIYGEAVLGLGVEGPVFSLCIIVGTDFGYVNHLQWSLFWPLLDDPDAAYHADNRIGYLCAAFEDSTCRIFVLRQSDFELRPTFASESSFGKNLPVYTKVPEIVLQIDEDAKISTGQCICFDWDEASRYLVAGYASGHVAVFNLLLASDLLRTVTEDYENCSTSLNPIWLITCHFAPVTAIIIDPTSSRYFYTGAMDRTLRTWDMDLRQEMECKKVGCVIDMCWIRGWIHLGVSVDAAVSNPSSQYNFLRFYTVGNVLSRPNIVEYMNVISTNFFEGMILSGCENGRVTISYYDAFWKECDYDRNKKKKNVINIGRVNVDENAFEPISYAKNEQNIIPFPEGEEPRLTFTFCRDRCQGSQEFEPSRDEVENIYRFYKYIRINKVCWAPDGKYVTIGYRNGLFAIIPADFDKLFT